MGTKDEICGQPTRPRQACSSKCPCSPGWSCQGLRCHHQRVHTLATALRRRSRRFSMCLPLFPKEDHGHTPRRKSSQLPRGNLLQVCSGLCLFVILCSDRPAEASTTRLVRAEDVKKPPKPTRKGECSSLLATNWLSNPMNTKGFLQGARVVSATMIRQGPRILQTRKKRNDPKGWIFCAMKHRTRSSGNCVSPISRTIEGQCQRKNHVHSYKEMGFLTKIPA